MQRKRLLLTQYYFSHSITIAIVLVLFSIPVHECRAFSDVTLNGTARTLTLINCGVAQEVLSTISIMQFSDLPVDVICLIIKYFDFDSLEELIRMLAFNPSGTLHKVAVSIKYSRILVTNEWQNLLRLLPRAANIKLIALLDKYFHVPLSYFSSILDDLESKWDERVPVKKSILLVFRYDLASNEIKESIIKRLFVLLQRMPYTVQHATRLFYLSDNSWDLRSSSPLEDLPLTTKFQESLESLSIHGTASVSAIDLSKFSGKDFSQYRRLSSLHLINIGISNLKDLKLPTTISDLRLSCNYIHFVDFQCLPSRLILLDLSHNRLTSIVANGYPKHLKTLNLKGNRIENIENLPSSVEDLNIALNEITGLNFDLPAKLKYLRLDVAQFYLMSESIRQLLSRKQVLVKQR